jgi:phosphate transport system protein
MSVILQRELGRLNGELQRLAGLAEQAVRQALQALRQRDAALARAVVQADGQIDREENRINEECLKVLALHQPVACDLRRVTAAMMVATDLERIAGLAVNIAERALRLADLPAAIGPPAALPALAERTVAMVHGSLEALAALDARQARAVCRADDEVDRLNDEAIAELVAAMKASPQAVEAGLSLFSVVRQLELIADHATNIAEDVVYLAEGALIRRRPEALAD